MTIDQILVLIQEQIPTLTVGAGLVGTMITNKIAMGRKNKELVAQSKDIKNLTSKTSELEKTLNDTKNTKAVLKIAKQHEDRLSRLEQGNEKKEN